MRRLQPALISLGLALAGASIVFSGCDPKTTFVDEAPFEISNIDAKVVKNTGQRQAQLDIMVVGAENGSRENEFLVSLEVDIDATTPNGESVQLAQDGHVEFEHTEASRMHRVRVPLFFELPKGAPDGEYDVEVKVTDTIGNATSTENIDVTF